MQEFILQAKRINQFEQRLAGEKTLRAELEAKSFFFMRRDDAAGAGASVQYAHGDPGLLEMIGARQPGNSPANDNRRKRN